MVGRVSTNGTNMLAQSSIAKLLKGVQNYQIQAATGYKAQRYSGLEEKSEQLVNMKVILNRGNQYIDNTVTVQDRMRQMEQGYNKLHEIATEWRSKLVGATSNNNFNLLPLATDAQAALSQVSNILNVQDGSGGYIFSGSKTDTRPVDTASFVTAVDVSVANYEYYQGDSTTLSLQADKDLSYDYGEIASDPTFEKLIRAMRAVQALPNDGSVLEDAGDLMSEVISELGTKLAEIGSLDLTLDKQRESHSDSLQIIAQSIGTTQEIDITEVMTKLSSQQTLLQAAFMTVSQMGQFSLVNYL